MSVWLHDDPHQHSDSVRVQLRSPNVTQLELVSVAGIQDLHTSHFNQKHTHSSFQAHRAVVSVQLNPLHRGLNMLKVM